MDGLGVTIRRMAGSDTGAIVSKVLGKTLTGVELVGDSLQLTFAEGVLTLSDHGQSCCETRYMTTDADLPYYVGATFMGGEIREAPSVDGGGEDHDVEFLVIQTSKGEFQMESHNEHNGYYGGFCIQAEWKDSPLTPSPTLW